MNPSSTGTELVPGTDVGGYVVVGKVGEGGMGVVYSAQQPSIGKRVAIKVLGPQYCNDAGVVARFEQEARLVNEIHHGNIIDIFQMGSLPDGRKYLVMELLEGESLSDRIARGRIPAPEAIEILDAICDALEAVHEKGVVHRDLKSDNVFLSRNRSSQRVKLLDFGLAKLAANDPRAITKTATGIVVGTPHYMAPEQARGKPVDNRTDIYALGTLAYKMVTGELPFKGEPVDLLIQHLNTPAPDPRGLAPELPPPLASAIMHMMAKFPEQRPTLAQLRATFADVRAGRVTAIHGPAVASMTGHSTALTAPITAATAAQKTPSTAVQPALPSQGRPGWFFPLIVVGVLAAAALAFAIVAALK